MRSPRRRPPRHLVPTALMGLMAGYFLIPFWWMLVAATKDNEALFSSAPLWFAGRFCLWSNLTELFTREDGVFLRWVANTVLYSFVSGVGATAVSTVAGYAFAKLRFPLRNLLFSLLLGLIMIPATALVLPTYLLLSKAGLTDSVWAVILPSLLNPFGVYLIRVYAHDAVPEEMLESARVDGAGELRILSSIAVPVMRPAIVTVLLFSVVAAWNNFFLPLVMLSDSRLFPLTVGMHSWYRAAIVGTGGETLFNLVVVGSVVAVMPLVVAFLMLQRHWRGGLTAGSLRG
jgi:multiple sugar transport system permease protein